MVLGKHSGSHGVILRYRELGIELDELTAGRLLPRIRVHANRYKRSPSAPELKGFYRDAMLTAAYVPDLSAVATFPANTLTENTTERVEL